MHPARLYASVPRLALPAVLSPASPLFSRTSPRFPALQLSTESEIGNELQANVDRHPLTADLTIGICAESAPYETRVAQVPATASRLLSSGFRVVAERGLGEKAGFSDEAFASVGVELLDDASSVLSSSEIILGLSFPPLEHLELMLPGTTLISNLGPFSLENQMDASLLLEEYLDFLDLVCEKGLTTLATDLILSTNRHRICSPRAIEFDGLRTQERAAGYRAVIESLGIVDGLPETLRVLVVGATEAGMVAGRTLWGLGCQEVVVAEWGKSSRDAVEISVDLRGTFVDMEVDGALESITDPFDVIIVTHSRSHMPWYSPVVLTSEALAKITKPGSVVVDLSFGSRAVERYSDIDLVLVEQLTDELMFGKDPLGVCHLVSNRGRLLDLLAARVPRSASSLYSASLQKLVKYCVWPISENQRFCLDQGLVEESSVLKSCCLTLSGEIVHPDFTSLIK